MINSIQNEYTPDFVSPPGETLQEIIEEKGMTQADLAERMGRPKKTINEIINGKAEITPNTSLQLERVLGIPSSFWNNRERSYREALARQQEQERLKEDCKWLNNFPVKEMVKKGWIRFFQDEVEQLKELLNFFGCASPIQWENYWEKIKVSYRKSYAFETDFYAVACWLRQGEIQASKINCDPYSRNKFKEVLNQIRTLTTSPPETFQLEIVRLCAKSGVAVVFVPQLKKTRTSGATRWLTSDKAVIQLSLRYKKDDHLWFSFFHEAGHILQHGKRESFLEGDNYPVQQQKEEEANTFAANFLIPPRDLQQFKQRAKPTKKEIREFAKEIGIAPGIVVGRLQHDGIIDFSKCNDLKRPLEWA